jgi:hypothetical protein
MYSITLGVQVCTCIHFAWRQSVIAIGNYRFPSLPLPLPLLIDVSGKTKWAAAMDTMANKLKREHLYIYIYVSSK